MAAQQTYRLFEVALKERRVLSPSLDRMVFTGADVARMTTGGPDQRIKVFFPLPGQEAPQVPSGEDWYPRYRALPDDQRPPLLHHRAPGDPGGQEGLQRVLHLERIGLDALGLDRPGQFGIALGKQLHPVTLFDRAGEVIDLRQLDFAADPCHQQKAGGF